MDVGGKRLIKGSIAAALLATAALVLASCGGGSSEAALCRPNLAPHLTPPGGGPNAFTMGIRVNRASDVDEIESAIGDRILPRDVFVINTEFPHSKPSDWQQSLERVSEKFRCNRIVTLTGLSPDAGGWSPSGPKGEPPDVTSDLLNHLGFEVAFDESPNPNASEPVERIGPEQAATCTQEILREGGAGVLY